MPTAVISGFNGGATVNAIEADARFDVVLTGDKAALAEQKKLVHKAVADGCAAETAFRNVKAGDKPRSGRHPLYGEINWKKRQDFLFGKRVSALFLKGSPRLFSGFVPTQQLAARSKIRLPFS